MKLIHLPTGETYEENIQPYKLLKKYPENYIRAELPEYWRVEGYDKSWEWVSPEWVKSPEGLYAEWEFVAYNKIGYSSLALRFPKLDEISRAEFEYHIYNPWKEGQAYAGTFGNEKRTESVHSPYIKTTAINKAECEPTKQPHYNQQPIEVIDMMLAVYGKEAVKHFCLLNSFKYRMRAGHKDDAMQDIEKAKWYEAKAKEIDATPTT